jgi:uncharacterized protein YdeI (YjbR/CyaY-like superfamily)
VYSLYHDFHYREKSVYMKHADRSKRLQSCYYENEICGALHKAWKGYAIAKNKEEDDKMERYSEKPTADYY